LRSALSDSIRLGTLEAFLSGLSSGELQRLHYDFELWARDDQLPPAFAAGGGPWTTWLMLGGRGAGKTRAGAE
jgi:phage terminase large subunit-like protein